MFIKSLKIMFVLLFSGTMMAQTGCACKAAKGKCVTTKTTKARCHTPHGMCDKEAGEMTAELPPNAKPGECYAKVFIPPQFKNVTERVLIRDASETIEIIPARYEWVEERVVVRDASTQLEAVDAEFASEERTLELNSGHTDWEINKDALCINPKDQPARDIFCLVNHPSARRTILTRTEVKPASVRETDIPAQYETIRKEKLVSAATTRKVCIPAEYENIERSVKVCDGRMAWQRVVCEKPDSASLTINANQTPSNATVNAESTQQP